WLLAATRARRPCSPVGFWNASATHCVDGREHGHAAKCRQKSDPMHVAQHGNFTGRPKSMQTPDDVLEDPDGLCKLIRRRVAALAVSEGAGGLWGHEQPRIGSASTRRARLFYP